MQMGSQELRVLRSAQRRKWLLLLLMLFLMLLFLMQLIFRRTFLPQKVSQSFPFPTQVTLRNLTVPSTAACELRLHH